MSQETNTRCRIGNASVDISDFPEVFVVSAVTHVGTSVSRTDKYVDGRILTLPCPLFLSIVVRRNRMGFTQGIGMSCLLASVR